MAEKSNLIWDDTRVGVKDECVLFMATDGRHAVAGAVPLEVLDDCAPGGRAADPIKAFWDHSESLRGAVEKLYALGRYTEIWEAPGILRHRRVVVSISDMR